MTVIYPSLFQVFKRFPDSRNVLHHLYVSDESFPSLCDNYRQCSEAVRYWADSKDEIAPERHREYQELLNALEMEITQYCSEGQNAGYR